MMELTVIESSAAPPGDSWTIAVESSWGSSSQALCDTWGSGDQAPATSIPHAPTNRMPTAAASEGVELVKRSVAKRLVGSTSDVNSAAQPYEEAMNHDK